MTKHVELVELNTAEVMTVIGGVTAPYAPTYSGYVPTAAYGSAATYGVGLGGYGAPVTYTPYQSVSTYVAPYSAPVVSYAAY